MPFKTAPIKTHKISQFRVGDLNVDTNPRRVDVQLQVSDGFKH
jgi:hypothetical protein